MHKTSALLGYHILATDGEIGHVDLTRETIKSGPSIETADIDPSETLPAVWIM